MLKYSKLLHHSGNNETFHENIDAKETQKVFLQSCIKKIREHVRPRLSKATVQVLGMEREVTPRFRTQGSWSYRTCISPAQTPPQEIDWDYGIYLPITVWEENGPPHSMAKAYFELVENILKGLCTQEKWTLNLGKDTCIRIKVSNWAHIDLPLYAAPEDQFANITESIVVAKSGGLAMESVDFAEDGLTRQQWEDLDSIVMATRSGEWRHSDPQAVANWFKDQVAQHGEQLRRVCRYLKAWRDHQWDEGGPTSVSLMIAAAQGFTQNPGRDDLALETVVKRLSLVFLGAIREAGIDDEKEDFNRIAEQDRPAVAQRFAVLAKNLEGARAASEQEKLQILHALHQQFGSRIPSDINRIETDSGEYIRSVPAKEVPPPIIKSTKAG